MPQFECEQVCGSGCPPLHRGDSAVWTERTCLGQTTQWFTTRGREKVAKTWAQTIKREEVKIKSEASESEEREIEHFTLMSNSYTFFIFCLVFISTGQ